MTPFATVYDFDEPVPVDLDAPDGGAVRIHVVGLGVDPGAVLRVRFDTAEFRRVADAGWFHLDGESTDVDWDPDIAIDASLALADDRAGTDAVGDGEPLLLALGGADATPVRSTESWFLWEALQVLEVPGDPDADLRIGIRTSHAPT